MTFTDVAGLTWDVIDFRLAEAPATGKKRVPLGSPKADGRAFVCGDVVRIYWFGQIAYRDTAPKTLANQFENARTPTESAARQHWGR